MHLGVCRRIVLFVGKQEFQVVGMMMAVGTGTVIDRAGRDDGHNTAGNMEYCWEKKRRVPGYVIRLGKQKKEKRKEKRGRIVGGGHWTGKTGEIHAPIVIRGRWWLNWRAPMETRLGSARPLWAV